MSVTVATKDRRRGVTLIEVMLAVLILVIALIGTSSTYVTGRQYIVNQRYYRTAAQLASQKLEGLKATGYDLIGDANAVEQLSIDGLTYQRRTQTQLTATPTAEVPKPCKKATVTIVWSLAGTQHQARLVTYIGP
jgi:prepilin-type N-terminal cleavage/methylation domain-containing protein